jgi:hypothetical protein
MAYILTEMQRIPLISKAAPESKKFLKLAAMLSDGCHEELRKYEKDIPSLLPVLGSLDSQLRDKICWSTLSDWFRSSSLSSKARQDTTKQLFSKKYLFSNLNTSTSKAAVLRSFSALTLADLVAGDADSVVFGEKDILSFIKRSIQYLSKERNRAGSDRKLGWIHCLAHVADLFFELSSHSSVTSEGRLLISEGLLSFVIREGELTFKYDEEYRIGRALACSIISLEDRKLQGIFAQLGGKFLSETPARQNLMNTLRCCCLQLIWAGSNKAAFVEPYIRF